MKENTVKVLRTVYEREHDLLNNRTNIFLLSQTVLVGAFTFASSNFLIKMNAIISAFGILFSCLWLVITIYGYQFYKRISKLLAEYEDKLSSDDKVYLKISPFIEGKKKVPIVTLILAWIFPISWILFWLIVCALTFFDHI